MLGISQYPLYANDLMPSQCAIQESHHLQLIRAILEMGGKECFATELSYVCPEIQCHLRGDCLGACAA